VELDDKGRCCGRKPMLYKSHNSTSTGRHRYCPRCDRAYDFEENMQIPNWAWRKEASEWKCNTSRKADPK
jgi:hypothetical protein